MKHLNIETIEFLNRLTIHIGAYIGLILVITIIGLLLTLKAMLDEYHKNY